MILIAPDKFKGTLSARRAADIIASEVPGDTLLAPMADGGEGTSDTLCNSWQWQRRDCYYVCPATREAVIDSSAVIGLQLTDPTHRDILHASSAPLGEKVREILDSGIRHVTIGIGGTATCDGGLGFLEALGLDRLTSYRTRLLGLSDVAVPLIAPIDQPSALMFAPQKGASPSQIPLLAARLEKVWRRFGCPTSPYDGAGGGLGFAIASVIGAQCRSGAEYVLERYNVPWDEISLVITGEGRIDAQTSQGKVVDVVSREAARHGVPVVAIGGTIEPGIPTERGLLRIIATDRFLPSEPLTPDIAAKRLRLAVKELCIRDLGNLGIH